MTKAKESKDLSERSPEQKDIVVLPVNEKGKDIIVGDIHGSIDILLLAIAALKDHDRLIIVGDLTDRGPGSFEVVKTIIKFNQARKRYGCPEIQVTRGNHEEIFLDYYREENPHLFHTNIGGDWAKKLTPDEKRVVADYFSSLPYIIHTPGADPFNVVHADMPITDQELQKRILDGNFTLTREEKYHATWAREGIGTDILGVGRHVTSVPTYCGHSIGEGVRLKSNHINLDVGAYSIDSACIVEHQTKICRLIGNLEKESLDLGLKKSAADIQKEIEMHFMFTAAIQKIINIRNSILENKAQKMNVAILELISEYEHQGYDPSNISLTILNAVLPGLTPEMQSSLHNHLLQQRANTAEEKLSDVSVVENVFIKTLIDLDKNRELRPLEKAKQIDAILLKMALEHQHQHQHQHHEQNIQSAYLIVLKEISSIFTQITKETLGDYLQTTKTHKLSEIDHSRMFVVTKSSDEPRYYINNALSLLGVNSEGSLKYARLKRVIFQEHDALLPSPSLDSLDISTKIEMIEARNSDPLTRYNELATAWSRGWASYFHKIPGDAGTHAVDVIEEAIESSDIKLSRQTPKLI